MIGVIRNSKLVRKFFVIVFNTFERIVDELHCVIKVSLVLVLDIFNLYFNNSLDHPSELAGFHPVSFC